jgi:hypothetical protein
MEKWLKNIKDLDDLKEKYRALCKLHHPDLGGNTATMQEINAEYEALLKSSYFNGEYEERKTNADIESGIRDIIEKTCTFKMILIEICGRWVWFTGETWRYKKLLKQYGCFWSPKKGAWYWRSAGEKRSRKPIPLDRIRAKYGSIIVEMKDSEAIS